MERLTRLGLLLGSLLAASPTLAKTPAFSTSDPRHAALYRLETAASTLYDSDDYALSMSQQTRDAWMRLHDAALKSRVNGHPHPLGGVALVMLASMDQLDGKNADALRRSSESLTLLAPFADAYPIAWMQGQSVKGYAQMALGDVSGGAETLAQASRTMDGYIASLPPEGIDRDVHMLRSNIAFIHAQALMRLGRNAEAVVAQKACMDARIAAVGPNSADALGAYYTYAQMLQRVDRNEEAEHYARLAVEIGTDHVDRKHPNYARALEALGLLLSRTGRRAESLDYLQRAIAIKRETVGTDSLYFHFALQNLGSVLLSMERYADAEPLFLEAERGFRALEGENSPQSARALAWAGAASLAEGRHDEAITRLSAALDRVKAGSDKDRDIGQRAYPYLIAALVEAGRMDAARDAAAAYATESAQLDNAPALPLAMAAMLVARTAPDGRDIGESARRVVAVVRADAAVNNDGELDEEQRLALDMALEAAATTEDGELALNAMAVMAASRIAQANRLVAQRLVQDPALAARVRGLQDRGRALEEADRALLKALAVDRGVADARDRRAAAAAAMAAEQSAIARDFPRWAEARGAEQPDLAALRRDLGKREAYLAVMPGFSGVYMLAISRDAVRIERAERSRADLIALVGRLRDGLSPEGFDGQAAYQLHAHILTPGIEAVLARTRSLRIVPTGAFASLPFAMLTQQPVTMARRDTPWLIRRFALTVQPGFLTTPAPARLIALKDQRFLGVGAPNGPGVASILATKAGGPFRGGAAATLSALPALPGSSTELQAVADQFGRARATLLTGAQATEAALRRSDLTSYGVMLFATHGLVGGEMEGLTEPALLLSPDGPDDGLLTASEVATMRIGADWVILSACNTAAGETAQAPAYSGLAQAFRYAGAGALLVSHWPVRDDASAFVTLETVKGADRGLTRAVALQKAMLKLMRSGRPDAAQPYIWAPFILIGR
ncbi:CHAT domain-containing tetratricopeptide repeat protein [Sphingobium abikonense]|uniref:CHAT domain-containing tetratricopeptide repeat protein n=1 Tax=Sphingobium abikonense TaxID=86193 RepID=UPI000786B1C7|nr:CHAT domain-containing tetratricopeptide repeat protein [Sphingobium abikonense]